MLAATLPLAGAMGIDPALITCDVSNAISRRVIEANGGAYAGRDDDELHFWVPTS
jgi:predicted acetyltransferase